MFSFWARKKFGNPTNYGERIFGRYFFGREYIESSPHQYGKRTYADAFYGANLSFEGIYHTRPPAFTSRMVINPTRKKRVNVRMKYYTSPETALRIANPRRAVFASAVSAWQALTASQKELYRLKSMGKHMSGYNVFLHEYLISH